MRSHLHIRLYDKLKADAAAHVRSVHTFGEVDAMFTPDVSQVHNLGYSLRSVRLQQILKSQHWIRF